MINTIKDDLLKVALGAENNGDGEVAARFREHIVTIERLERENEALRREANAGKALAMGIRNLIAGWGSTSQEMLLKQYQAEVER